MSDVMLSWPFTLSTGEQFYVLTVYIIHLLYGLAGPVGWLPFGSWANQSFYTFDKVSKMQDWQIPIGSHIICHLHGRSVAFTEKKPQKSESGTAVYQSWVSGSGIQISM